MLEYLLTILFVQLSRSRSANLSRVFFLLELQKVISPLVHTSPHHIPFPSLDLIQTSQGIPFSEYHHSCPSRVWMPSNAACRAPALPLEHHSPTLPFLLDACCLHSCLLSLASVY